MLQSEISKLKEEIKAIRESKSVYFDNILIDHVRHESLFDELKARAIVTLEKRVAIDQKAFDEL
jgi:hypothetical protein